MELELVIFIGLQASGKSSFYRERFAATHVHVSKDNFPNNRNKTRRQRELVEEGLAAGNSVVVDNTNLTRAERSVLIELGHRFGTRVTGYCFESKIQQCLERNRAREGKARVPDVALYVSRAKQEVPSLAEGFDELCFVRLTEQGFEVEPWRDEDNLPAEFI